VYLRFLSPPTENQARERHSSRNAPNPGSWNDLHPPPTQTPTSIFTLHTIAGAILRPSRLSSECNASYTQISLTLISARKNPPSAPLRNPLPNRASQSLQPRCKRPLSPTIEWRQYSNNTHSLQSRWTRAWRRSRYRPWLSRWLHSPHITDLLPESRRRIHGRWTHCR
jgi:hypothetical protein